MEKKKLSGSGDVDGIGAATALHIVPFHPRVVITGRNKERLNAVGEKLRAAGIPRDRVSADDSSNVMNNQADWF